MHTIRNLTAAALRLGIHITPTFDAETKSVTVTAADAVTLTAATRRLMFGSTETNRITRILGGGRFEVVLDVGAAADLTRALVSLEREVDRDKRIRRGQFTGPMSGPEAAKFMRGRHGL